MVVSEQAQIMLTYANMSKQTSVQPAQRVTATSLVPDEHSLLDLFHESLYNIT
jgi:hypothetical protein